MEARVLLSEYARVLNEMEALTGRVRTALGSVGAMNPDDTTAVAEVQSVIAETVSALARSRMACHISALRLEATLRSHGFVGEGS